MLKQINGDHVINDYVAPASTAFAFNDAVTRDADGQLAKATASTPRSELLGLIQATILSSDSNYAVDKSVPVLEFHDGAEFEADVDTGTATASMVGKRFDLADANGINVNSALQKSVEISRYLSASKVRVKFVTEGDESRLVSYTQRVVLADFTDGGGATGTLDLDTVIPAGAVFARSLVKNLTGAVGESTAVMTIGDGTDVDRYNTGTPSVASDASAGVDMGAPSGTLFHSVAKTPKLTVTEDDDFADITSGLEFDVTLFWYQAD